MAPNYNGQMINTTHSEGRSVSQAWVHAFQMNEKRAESGKRPFTDEEISAWMATQFPDRPPHVFKCVMRCRAQYNRGALACQNKVSPRKKSRRFGSVETWEGIVFGELTARGTLLKEFVPKT